MFHHISKPQEESWEYSQPSHKRPPKMATSNQSPDKSLF